jgi:hypothetical protein
VPEPTAGLGAADDAVADDAVGEVLAALEQPATTRAVAARLAKIETGLDSLMVTVDRLPFDGETGWG